MLYGVRRDLQEQLVREGYRMRVYVPFGTQWYPYLMRRLAERPANVAFITGNVVREMIGPESRDGRTRGIARPITSKGDESTIGGYAAVHDRPAAFEGSDGFSYSVELMTEETGDRADAVGRVHPVREMGAARGAEPGGASRERLSRARRDPRRTRARSSAQHAARRRSRRCSTR